jgi:CheY-like chemotaxis protein
MPAPANAEDRLFLTTVLIVDPDPDARELYALTLADVAHEIQEADDGRIALAKALAHPPDLLVTEMRVPYIDGYALCRTLRSDPLTARTPIIIATADAAAAATQRIRSVGASAGLVKPILASALIATIRSVVTAHPHVPGTDAPVVAAQPRARDHARLSMKCHSHERYVTTTPPREPPPLRCPRCDRPLVYADSQIGGVNAASPEQWDRFKCRSGCGSFEYRHRTKKLVSRP